MIPIYPLRVVVTQPNCFRVAPCSGISEHFPKRIPNFEVVRCVWQRLVLRKRGGISEIHLIPFCR
jgi:hypothetical protein